MISLGKELLQVDIASLSQFVILNEIRNSSSYLLEPVNELMMEIYKAEFKVFADMLIKIFEGPRNQTSFENNKTQIRAELEKVKFFKNFQNENLIF